MLYSQIKHHSNSFFRDQQSTQSFKHTLQIIKKATLTTKILWCYLGSTNWPLGTHQGNIRDSQLTTYALLREGGCPSPQRLRSIRALERPSDWETGRSSDPIFPWWIPSFPWWLPSNTLVIAWIIAVLSVVSKKEVGCFLNPIANSQKPTANSQKTIADS